ncbi:MAG: helix-turn-helix domain-containing protein [Prevotella sp.]|nr:helix-turn-helix domain-containing protein [Prevotella sp.]
MLAHRFVLLHFLLVVSLGLMAQRTFLEQYNVSTLDMRDGLPSNNVNDLFTDSEGFVWLSAYGGGIVRYDGYGFSSFYTRPQGFQWRSHSSRKVCEDKFHRLWMVFDEYTQVIDMRTMTVATPASKDRVLEEILKQRGVNVVLDKEGKLWLVTMSHIHCVAFHEDGSVKNIVSCPYIGNTPSVAIADIDGNGKVWASIDGGIFRMAAEGERIVRSEISPLLSRLNDLYVTALLRQGEKVWIATNHGLRLFSPHAGGLLAYSHGQDAMSLSHDFVSCLAMTANNTLVVGTLGGIDFLMPDGQHFEHWNTSTAPWPLGSNFVSCIHQDNGRLWIGTETAGAICLSPRLLALHHFEHTADPSSISPNAVNAMHMQPDGTLWVGTVEGGLNRKNPDGTFTHFTTHNSQLSHNSVSSLVADSSRLWIGTWGGGVNCMDMKTNAISRLSVDARHAPMLNFVGAMAYDNINNGLWIGSNDGIFFYDFGSQALVEPFEGCLLARGCIGALIDHDRQLWIGCLEGAYVIDVGKGRNADGQFSFQHLRDKLDNPESGIIDKITCFYQTQDGTLWMGSNGYGLYRRKTGDDGKDIYVAYTTNDGLANNSVKGIVEDNEGKLWVATGNGLSVLNPQTGAFTTLREENGLLCQQFYWNGAMKGDDGTLWFGSQEGLTCLTSGSLVSAKPPRLHLTHLTIDNQDAVAGDGHIDEDISCAKVIRLHESNKSLVIDFSALNYGNETQGVYSYRMRGLEKEWVLLEPGEHSVRYTSLPSGDYVFEVRYASALNSGKDSVVSVEVAVKPYFYKSWWFISLVLLALLAAAVALYKQRVRQLRRQEEEKLMRPIEDALRESEDPEALQKRIQGIIDNRKRMAESVSKTAMADDQLAAQSVKPFMERIVEFMEQNYMNSEYGVTELSEQMGINRTLLSKKLNEETGMSPGQFMRHYRLDMARKMLERNAANRNIAEIAFSVGFNDPKYFTRCFTKEFGVSPSSWGKK